MLAKRHLMMKKHKTEIIEDLFAVFLSPSDNTVIWWIFLKENLRISPHNQSLGENQHNLFSNWQVIGSKNTPRNRRELILTT
jgi:hypothetical protein